MKTRSLLLALLAAVASSCSGPLITVASGPGYGGGGCGPGGYYPGYASRSYPPPGYPRRGYPPPGYPRGGYPPYRGYPGNYSYPYRGYPRGGMVSAPLRGMWGTTGSGMPAFDRIMNDPLTSNPSFDSLLHPDMRR